VLENLIFMFVTLQYRLSLRKLFNKRAKVKKLYEKDRKKAAKDGKPYAEIESIWSLESFEVHEIDEEIKVLVTTHLNTANRLLVPIPDIKNETMWMKLDTDSQMALTPIGISELRSTIRKEKQEKKVNLSFWLTALIGLIGAITGLIAIIKK